MANTLKPVFTSSIDRWRTSLSRRQVALTEQSLAIEMEVMGYETTGARTALRWMQIVGGMAADFIWRSWRRVRRRSRPRHTD